MSSELSQVIDQLLKTGQDKDIIYNRSTGIMYVVPKFDPSVFQLANGAYYVYSDIGTPGTDYKDCDTAATYVGEYENNEYSADKLKPEDHNNLGCAYLWQRRPHHEKGLECFTKAEEGSSSSSNKDLFIANRNAITTFLNGPVVPGIPVAILDEIRSSAKPTDDRITMMNEGDVKDLFMPWDRSGRTP